MDRKARRRAIFLLERRRLLRGAGALADFAAPAGLALDSSGAAGFVRSGRLRAAPRPAGRSDRDGYGD